MGNLSSLGFSSCFCGNNVINVNENRYYHKKQLGEGGFSYVDLVEEKKSGELRALKRIVCHDKAAEHLALEEARYCMKFHHKNVVRLIEHCVHRKAHLSEVWLVFPYYEVGTLYDEYMRLQSSSKQMNNRRILHLMRGICEGLRVFHHYKPQALAHRDIKPANILLTSDDVPVIMDLGSMAVAHTDVECSRSARNLQDLASERCTLPYRAPELFDARMCSFVNEKVDIWSLGCVFYSLMYLQGPFDEIWLKGDSVALAVQSNRIKFPSTAAAASAVSTTSATSNQFPTSFQLLTTDLLTIDPLARPHIDDVIQRLNNLT